MNTSSTVGQKRTNSDSNESQNIKKNKTTHFQPQQVELKNKLKKSEDAYNELNKYKNSLVEELGEKTTNLNNTRACFVYMRVKLPPTVCGNKLSLYYRGRIGCDYSTS